MWELCKTLPLFILVSIALCKAQELPWADGLWSRGNKLLLFARMNACGGPYRPIQPLLSNDAGKTWSPTGPVLESSDLKFVFNAGADLLVAGEDIAEGPSHAPFLLRRTNDQWMQTIIYDDSAELLRIGSETKTGRLLAWIRHIDPLSENLSGSLYLHESIDHGSTWTAHRTAATVPRSLPGVVFFRPLSTESGPWRVSVPGTSIERRDSRGDWHSVTQLPLPIQQHCPK